MEYFWLDFINLEWLFFPKHMLKTSNFWHEIHSISQIYKQPLAFLIRLETLYAFGICEIPISIVLLTEYSMTILSIYNWFNSDILMHLQKLRIYRLIGIDWTLALMSTYFVGTFPLSRSTIKFYLLSVLSVVKL